MAQQIQFIYLTQSDYEGLTPQTNKIYFTSDTHRIYKGSDLYAATTFDQLNFSTISASGIFVDGSAVSLEGHSHSMLDISGLDAAISAATSNFATWGHQHVIADVTNLPGIVSGITTTGITKSDGNFTNLNASSIQASAIDVTGTGTFSSVSASTATFGDLVVTGDVSMTLSQVAFGSIMASDIQVNGTSVALVGHTHAMSEITDLDTTAFASSIHTHPELSGLTSSSITKETGTFTNLVVTNASLDATSITASGVEVNGGIQANSVSASSATFQSLTVTGEVTMSLPSVDFQSINASLLTVNGSVVSLEGHSHSASEISGLDAVISAATSSFASSDHTHPELSGITQSTITKDTGTFTNLVVASASFTATNVEAEEISASTATFGDINVTGTASLNATHVSASTLTADSGTFTNLTVVSASFEATSIEASEISTASITVGGSAVALVGHTHPASEVTGLQSVLDGLSSTYALASHSHAISDITNLAPILSGITSSSVEKDTVTADIGNFRLLSVSGSANFMVNNVSANAVTVNGTNVALVGHSHSVSDIDGLSTALSAYASASHSHSISDITNLETTLSGFASSGHTHEELAGITSSSIDRTTGSFDTLTASTATFGLLNVTSSATFDITNLVASTLSVRTLDVVSTSVSTLTVADLIVTSTLTLNSKALATEEYVLAQISAAIGQVLASAF